MTKSFKERNPDLDMDEIQRNPNIPDDIKAVLNGSVLDEDDGVEIDTIDMVDVNDANVGELLLDKYDDLFMEESDDENKGSRRRKKKVDDDDWYATAKERREKTRKDTPPKRRGGAKRKSVEGEIANSTEKPAEKVKRKYVRKKKNVENDAATVENKTKVVKKPPEMPFNLTDSTKKFEGKIPNRKSNVKSTTATSSLVQSDSTMLCTTTITTTTVNALTTSVPPQTSASVEPQTTSSIQSQTPTTTATETIDTTINSTSAIPKTTSAPQHRNQNQTQNNLEIKVPPPVAYAKSAITYPDPKGLSPSDNGIKIDLSATLSSLLSPDMLVNGKNQVQTSTSGNGIQTGSNSGKTTTLNTSKYVSI